MVVRTGNVPRGIEDRGDDDGDDGGGGGDGM